MQIEGTGGASNHQLIVDSTGNVLAVWKDDDTVGLWSNRYNAATNSWGTATPIEGAGNSYNLQSANNATGNALLVWQQFNGKNYSIWSSHYDSTTNTWSPATRIQTNAGITDTRYPKIAIDDIGNALVIWSQSDGIPNSDYRVWFNRYNAATSNWGTETLVNDYISDISDLKIADVDGNALAVWYQKAGDGFTIWSSRYSAETNSWGTETLIEANLGYTVDPQIATDHTGNAIAVWSQRDGMLLNLWSKRYYAATNHWGIATLLEANASNVRAQIAIDTSSNVLVIWNKYDSSPNFNRYRYSIWSNRYNFTTNNWGTPIQIQPDVAMTLDMHIATNTTGNATVVWNQREGMFSDMWSNFYKFATNTWSTPISFKAENAYNPLITFDPNGNALTVWAHFDGTDHSLWYNRFH